LVINLLEEITAIRNKRDADEPGSSFARRGESVSRADGSSVSVEQWV